MVRTDCCNYINGMCKGLRHLYCEVEDCRFYKNKDFYEEECVRLYGRNWRNAPKLKKVDNAEELYKLYELGYNFSEISKMTGYSHSTVAKYVKQMIDEKENENG